ncbi:glycine cleavage T C-terminal barrel domain-containing protein [Streptomyces sp. NPDC007205]|uniref:glycine cleavage T C-terminal barrel domain-containing protein n=1 Tax=Streptomyces sp. NPDC007205 TaxID=3154316 RepID=UPI0033E74C62
MKATCTTLAEEYTALRQATGLIHYEGAGLVKVTGLAAAAYLGRVGTRSVDFLLEGQSTSSLLLREDGTVIAEVLIHCLGGDYLVEIWPAQADSATAHLLAMADDSKDLQVEDVSAQHAVVALEGPASFKIAQKYLDFPVASLAYRSSTTTEWNGTAVTLSRTGLTGEYGYKFIVPAQVADALCAELRDLGAVPCGRDALDVCRMEVRFANLEQENTGDPVTPFDVGLQWMVDTGADFVGRAALEQLRDDEARRAPVCWVADADCAAVPASGTAIAVSDAEVGAVTHAVWSPSLERYIGTARVAPAVAASGQVFRLAGSEVAVRTVSAPFLTATSLDVPLD